MDDASSDLSLASRLRRAVDRTESLLLYYQPLVDLTHRLMIGVEALLRWFDDERGWSAPPDSSRSPNAPA